jgi:RNA ligase
MPTPQKPLGTKSYGHIAHLPGSRMGPGDHKCHEGQKRIATEKARDRHDRIVVQEKLDGSNVGIARLDGRLYPLTRAGYLAETSPYEQHWQFGAWVSTHQTRFLALLEDGERLCGEWLMQAHGTRYALTHEPLVAFDLMCGERRTPYAEFCERLCPYEVITPRLLWEGGPLSIAGALDQVRVSGHGALDPVEGAVWRVERDELINPRQGGARAWKVDFLAKYVRPEKQDGLYLPEKSGQSPVWNWRP